MRSSRVTIGPKVKPQDGITTGRSPSGPRMRRLSGGVPAPMTLSGRIHYLVAEPDGVTGRAVASVAFQHRLVEGQPAAGPPRLGDGFGVELEPGVEDEGYIVLDRVPDDVPERPRGRHLECLDRGAGKRRYACGRHEQRARKASPQVSASPHSRGLSMNDALQTVVCRALTARSMADATRRSTPRRSRSI